jgi:phospholipid transport system transporter-binding protein
MMQKKVDITFENNMFYISGDLNFYNVMSLYQKSLLHFKKVPLSQLRLLHFNFSRVNSIDSAGLALVIEWIKFSKKQKLSIRFSNFPKNLLSIAEAARIESLFQ